MDTHNWLWKQRSWDSRSLKQLVSFVSIEESGECRHPSAQLFPILFSPGSHARGIIASLTFPGEMQRNASPPRWAPVTDQRKSLSKSKLVKPVMWLGFLTEHQQDIIQRGVAGLQTAVASPSPTPSYMVMSWNLYHVWWFEFLGLGDI